MSDKRILAVTGATGAQGGGLVQAILSDPERRFAVRAITRKPESEKARALAAAGAEVVRGDADQPASLVEALSGAWGAFFVTPFWEHLSTERELAQATAMARASRAAGLGHVVWSTLEDTRRWFPLDDSRLPTLHGRYKVPHFDAKGEADAVFAAEAAPTSYLMAAFYWENFVYFGQGPRRGADGQLVFALPFGGGKLPGIAAADIGKAALGIFRRGPAAAGERFGIAGDVLSGPEYAAAFARAFGEPVAFRDMPFDEYRALSFPGADDMGNMYQFQAILGDEFLALRSPERTRELAPDTQRFATWLAAHAGRIPLG